MFFLGLLFGVVIGYALAHEDFEGEERV